jgi:subtilisin family serine protease
MWKYLMSVFLMLGLFSCGSGNQQGVADNAKAIISGATLKNHPSSKGSRHSKYVPREVLVKFRAGTSISTIQTLHRALGTRKIKEIRHIGIQKLKLSDNLTVEEVVRQYRADSNVEFAEPNYIIRTAAVPNDSGYPSQWGLHNTGQTGGTVDADIHAEKAWDITTGSENIIIAVVDTGVAYDHPDLAPNIWVNTRELNGTPGVDDDGNGYIDDYYGWDFVDHDGYPSDYDQHGSHVAGILAARGNNGFGISGVMWSAKIMPLRFLGVTGTGDVATAADAITYAVDNGARIINASWGEYDYSNALYDAINYANRKDVLLVTAAGNETNDNNIDPFYPASYNLPNIISVAASDQYDNLTDFSNYGSTSVHLAAPGNVIYSTVPEFGYGSPVTLYSENFDSAYGNLPLLGWTRGGSQSTWAVTQWTGVDGTNSLEDSPGANYHPNTNSWAGYMIPFTSVKNSRYRLSFKWKGHIDHATSDFFNINYSQDGKTWESADWRDGSQLTFISDYTDEITSAADMFDSFYFGFGVESDSGGNYEGVYVDDVVLSREPITIDAYSYESAGWSGTSMSAPFVSGVAGLVWSANPSFTSAQVKDILMKTVDKKASFADTISGGRVNAFAALSFAALPAPTNLSAAVLSKTQIDLSWQDNATNETGFILERKTGGHGTYAEIASPGANLTTYSDTNLSPGTYYYRVKAYNAEGDSSYSNEASATIKKTSSGGGGGGGCSIGGVQNHQTAIADTILLFMPLGIVWIIRRLYAKSV